MLLKKKIRLEYKNNILFYYIKLCKFFFLIAQIDIYTSYFYCILGITKFSVRCKDTK